MAQERLPATNLGQIYRGANKMFKNLHMSNFFDTDGGL